VPSYSVNSADTEMLATGIVAMVQEWIKTADGTRKPSDEQARDEATGMPLWGVEVMYRSESYGRESTATAMVEVGSVEQPHPEPLTPIRFDRLVQ
jgi:hypothetical protein